MAADELQPSTTKAFTDIERIMVAGLSVLVKQTSHDLKKVLLADVDIARRMTRPWCSRDDSGTPDDRAPNAHPADDHTPRTPPVQPTRTRA